MMQEPVIVQTAVEDKIRLEDEYEYNARLTIGLAKQGDFYLIIDFIELTMEDLNVLVQLSRLSRQLSIKSKIIDREQYNITHIVVTKFSSNSNLAMTWECLSDVPSSPNSLIIE